MNDRISSGARKTPEAEKKFGLTLRAQLNFSPEEPVNVVFIGIDRSENNTALLEAISSRLEDDDFLGGVGGIMLSAIVKPPEIRTKLADIAKNECVHSIELNETFPPMTIPKSYFR